MASININSLCLQYASYCSYKKFSIEELYRKNKIEWDDKIKSEHLKVLEKSKNDFIVRNDTIEVITKENIDKINGTSDALYKIGLQQRVDVSLVERLIRFFDQKFNIKFMHFHELENAICIFTSSQLFIKVSIMIKNALSNVVHKRLEMFTNEMLNMKNLKNVLETNIEDLNTISCFKVLFNKKDNLQPGVYLSYFQNCPDLDSPDDSTFDKIKSCIEPSMMFDEMNITRYENILFTSKWEEFDRHTLSEYISSGVFTYDIVRRNNDYIVILLGETYLIFEMKDSINRFFNSNNLLIGTLTVSEDLILYLTHVAHHVKKDLENEYKNYNLKIEYKESQISIINYPSNDFEKISQRFSNEKTRMKIKYYEMDVLPGLEELLNKNNRNFKSEIEQLIDFLDVTKTFIGYEIVGQNHHSGATSTASASMDDISCVEVGNCKIRIIQGDIKKANTDVIVNSTNIHLKLDCGSVSKSLLEAAGQDIQQQCNSRYPKGINNSQVAVTTAGLIKNVKSIYHISPNHYDKNKHSTCLQELRVIIQNLLNQLKNDNYKSISLPCIGLGTFNYPSVQTIQLFLDECVAFLSNNMHSQYEIRFFLFENNNYKIFANELVKYKNHLRSNENLVVASNTNNNALKFGKSKLNLLNDDITKVPADVILNSTKCNLDLNSGSVSAAILKAGGPQIQNECKLNYPQGIDFSTIACTSAGDLKDTLNVKNIYHVAVNRTIFNFFDDNDRQNQVKMIVANCLNKLRDDGLKSISFPAIDVGTIFISQPADKVAKIMLEECTAFLDKYKNDGYTINIVINDQKIFNNFLSEFDVLKSCNDVAKNYVTADVTDDFINIQKISENNKKVVKFKFISDDEAKIQLLLDLLFDKFKEKSNNKNEQYQFSNLLRETLDFQVNSVDNLLIGPEKAATENINKDNRRESKESDSKWEYNKDGNWELFGIYADSAIEQAYQQNICFLTTDDETGRPISVDLNLYSLFGSDGKVYEIRRREAPSDAASNLSDIAIELLDKNKDEYRQVYDKFIQAFKLKKNFEFTFCEIQKVKNERLEKQYMIHKNYMRSKNGHENEQFLYHGTQEESVNSICKYGFNRSYCGINGTKYGKGVYFAKYSSYSNEYAKSANNGFRKMFYCDVIVGDYTPGSRNMNVPPKKPNGEPYDSTSGEDNTVFVVYNDNQCYPRYLITYSYETK